MSRSSRSVLLALVTYSSLLGGLLLALHVARSAVNRVAQELLRAETGMAVELLRQTPDTTVLNRVFPDRWRLTDEVDPLLDEVVVLEAAGGVYGKASVYDADSWDQVGTLYLRDSDRRITRLPKGVVLTSLLALLALFPISIRWTRPPGPGSPRGRAYSRLGLPLAAALMVAWPTWLAGSWAARALEGATQERIRTTLVALRAVPDLEDLIEKPGGVYQLTGIPFILRDNTGRVAFSSLPSAPTEELGRVPPPAAGVFVADRVPYAIADVGRVRLTMLPYEHANQPGTAMLVIVLISLAVAALPVSLSHIADRQRMFRRNLVAWSFLAPSFVHLVIFTAGPLLFAAWLSLHRWSLLDSARPFVGLDNYASLLADSSWWTAVGNTAVFTLHVPVSMALALALALLVHRRVRGMVFLRALFFLPSITSLVAIAIIWQWMLHDEYGLINWMLSRLGLGAVGWLTSPNTALLAIMMMSIWIIVGYQMILFQAGLVAVPQELYDAAHIDGAGPWRRFLHVTLPGLRHTLFFVLVTSVIGSFQIFGAVYVMTEGGPLHSTDVAVFHIYEEAWEFFRFGNAAAMSWVLFAIIFLVTWLQFRTLERRVTVQVHE